MGEKRTCSISPKSKDLLTAFTKPTFRPNLGQKTEWQQKCNLTESNWTGEKGQSYTLSIPLRIEYICYNNNVNIVTELKVNASPVQSYDLNLFPFVNSPVDIHEHFTDNSRINNV